MILSALTWHSLFACLNGWLPHVIIMFKFFVIFSLGCTSLEWKYPNWLAVRNSHKSVHPILLSTGVVDEHRNELDNAFSYNQFLIESRETQNWIKDKMVLVESTDELGNDLAGIVQLQRRLGGLQRDMAAIEAKVGHLDEQVSKCLTSYFVTCLWIFGDVLIKLRVQSCSSRYGRFF